VLLGTTHREIIKRSITNIFRDFVVYRLRFYFRQKFSVKMATLELFIECDL
jgi:hypothetical protein